MGVLQYYTARTRLRQRPRNATQPRPSPSRRPPPLRSSRVVRPPRGLPDQAKLIGRTNGAARPQSQREARNRRCTETMSTSSTNSAAASPAVSGLDYDDTALTLALPGSSAADPNAAADRKRIHADHDKPPSPKARAVGWPPVRAYRRNALRDEQAKLVKVAVDGAPYLRKVDLAAHDGYAALLRALHGMFASCLGADGAGRLVDAATGAEYVPTYEDKDGDWMLVGDVPFKMFVDSCKRIRLMKSSEAVSLSPRTSSQ